MEEPEVNLVEQVMYIGSIWMDHPIILRRSKLNKVIFESFSFLFISKFINKKCDVILYKWAKNKLYVFVFR